MAVKSGMFWSNVLPHRRVIIKHHEKRAVSTFDVSTERIEGKAGTSPKRDIVCVLFAATTVWNTHHDQSARDHCRLAATHKDKEPLCFWTESAIQPGRDWWVQMPCLKPVRFSVPVLTNSAPPPHWHTRRHVGRTWKRHTGVSRRMCGHSVTAVGPSWIWISCQKLPVEQRTHRKWAILLIFCLFWNILYS